LQVPNPDQTIPKTVLGCQQKRFWNSIRRSNLQGEGSAADQRQSPKPEVRDPEF
jgi:hypothetical protein